VRREGREANTTTLSGFQKRPDKQETIRTGDTPGHHCRVILGGKPIRFLRVKTGVITVCLLTPILFLLVTDRIMK